MYSPVCHIAGPNTNMIRTRRKTKRQVKKKPKTASVIVRPPGLAPPVGYGEITRGKRPGLPLMMMKGPSAICRNYELVTSYTAGNAGFQESSFSVNPGIPTVFPWLSSIAKNYTKYRFLKLRYFFSGSCPTSTSGKVWMRIIYDPSDAAPANLGEVLQSENSCSGPAWFGGTVSNEKAFDPVLAADANIYVDADCSRFGLPWYIVRNTDAATRINLTGTPTGGLGTLALTGSTIDNTSVPCRVGYGNNSVTSSTIPGELYVAYEVELIEPVAPSSTN